MKKVVAMFLGAALSLGLVSSSEAHFGMIIPSESTVMETKNAEIKLDIKFWHPFANVGMSMEKPKVMQVYQGGKATDLLPGLKETQTRGQKTWATQYKLTRPGLYTFAMEPEPYFEPKEDVFIIHYTKVMVDAFGDDEGWDQPLGLKTEIVPFSNPTGLYGGNVFQGQVLMDGKPVPFAMVEVEWYPGPELAGQPPFETMVAQTVKADGNGLFTYAVPTSGWWGFAALNTADYKLPKDGQDKEIELGAVFWAYFHEMKPALPIK